MIKGELSFNEKSNDRNETGQPKRIRNDEVSEEGGGGMRRLMVLN